VCACSRGRHASGFPACAPHRAQTRVRQARARGWSQVTAAAVSAATGSATLTVAAATFRTSHSSVGPALARTQSLPRSVPCCNSHGQVHSGAHASCGTAGRGLVRPCHAAGDLDYFTSLSAVGAPWRDLHFTAVSSFVRARRLPCPAAPGRVRRACRQQLCGSQACMRKRGDPRVHHAAHRAGAAPAAMLSVQNTYSPVASLRRVTVAVAAPSASASTATRQGRSESPGTSTYAGAGAARARFRADVLPSHALQQARLAVQGPCCGCTSAWPCSQ